MNSSENVAVVDAASHQTECFQRDLFCEVENYAWEWPKATEFSRALKFVPVYLRKCQWSEPLTSFQWAMLDETAEEISRQVSTALSKPCAVYSKDDTTRIEFLGCIAWVNDKRYRNLYLETRRPFGAWEKSSQKINLLKPLEDGYWLDVLVQHWSSRLTATFGPQTGEAVWNIQSTLSRILKQLPRGMLATNRQIKYHLELLPALVSVVRRLCLWSPELLVNNETYAFLWKEEQAWQNIGTHYPGLAHFYYLLRKEWLLDENANLGGMRTRCFELGLNKAGWRFLCRHGEEAYVSFYSDLDDNLAPPRELIAYINWQADAGLDKPLEQIMASRVYESGCLTLMKDGNCQVILDPRLAHVAQEVFHLSEKEGHQEWYWGQLRNWRRVLEWIIDEQPNFDKNQFKSGWKSIFRCYEDWIRFRKPALEWKPVLGSFRLGKWWIKELTSSTNLELESLRMHHCAVTYVEDCSAGKYVMFSVEDAESHLPMATIGFTNQRDRWLPDQIRGKFNSDPGPEFSQVSEKIQERMSSL